MTRSNFTAVVDMVLEQLFEDQADSLMDDSMPDITIKAKAQLIQAHNQDLIEAELKALEKVRRLK